MPLMDAHANYISSAIEHFFYDLPTEPSQESLNNLHRKINYFARIFAEAFARSPFQPVRGKLVTETDEAYEFFHCVSNPQAVFIRLEHQSANTDFMVAEVQLGILVATLAQLQASLEKIDPQKKTGWDLRNILYKNCKPHEANTLTKFTSKPLPADYGFFEHAYDIPQDSNKIFKAEIVQRFHTVPNQVTYINLDLHVRINLPDGIIDQIISDFIPTPQLSSNREIQREKAFKKEAETRAELYAEYAAVDAVLAYIERKNNRDNLSVESLNPVPMDHQNPRRDPTSPLPADLDFAKLEPVELARPALPVSEQMSPTMLASIGAFNQAWYEELPMISPPPLTRQPNFIIEASPIFKPSMRQLLEPGLKLLTYNYYLHAIDTKRMAFDVIMQLNSYVASKLTAPAIINLIKHGFCDFELAQRLHVHEIKVLEDPFYMQKILAREILLTEFSGLNEHESKNLVLPSVINLQKKNPEIPFCEIKKITLQSALLFADDAWLELLSQKKVNFYDLQSLTGTKKNALTDANIFSQFAQAQQITKDHLKAAVYTHLFCINITKIQSPAIRVQKFQEACQQNGFSDLQIIAGAIRLLLLRIKQKPHISPFLKAKITRMEKNAAPAPGSASVNINWIQEFKNFTNGIQGNFLNTQMLRTMYMGGRSNYYLSVTMALSQRINCEYTPLLAYEKIIDLMLSNRAEPRSAQRNEHHALTRSS